MDKKRALRNAERLKSPHAPSPGEVTDLFNEAPSLDWGHSADELNYDDMLYLADLFTGWAMDGRTEPH
jgi:hypothetical protein